MNGRSCATSDTSSLTRFFSPLSSPPLCRVPRVERLPTRIFKIPCFFLSLLPLRTSCKRTFVSSAVDNSKPTPNKRRWLSKFDSQPQDARWFRTFVLRQLVNSFSLEFGLGRWPFYGKLTGRTRGAPDVSHCVTVILLQKLSRLWVIIYPSDWSIISRFIYNFEFHVGTTIICIRQCDDFSYDKVVAKDTTSASSLSALEKKCETTAGTCASEIIWS